VATLVAASALAGCGSNDDGRARADFPRHGDTDTPMHGSLASLVEASPIRGDRNVRRASRVVGAQEEPDAGISRRVLVYRFEPSEVLRDTFWASSSWSNTSSVEGQLRVVVAASDVRARAG
jgi:hypothetical protein